jgi:hypothetical protein
MINNQVINKLFDAGIKSLNDKQNLFNQIEKNPELIITKLFNPELHQPYYSYPIMVFGNSKELIGIDKSYHNMQKYLEILISSYFKTLDNTIQVKTIEPNRYSSDFMITCDNYKILRFDIYRHCFSDNIEFNLDYYDKDIQRLKNSIDKNEKTIQKYINYKINPYKRAKGIKDIIYVFFNKNKVKNYFQEQIDYENNLIKMVINEINRFSVLKEKWFNIEPELNSKYNFWKNKFIEWGYREEENNYLPKNIRIDTK